MAYCTSCGSQIPDDQGRSCSMCYGDMEHGKDGYYREWAEHQSLPEEIHDIDTMPQPSEDF